MTSSNGNIFRVTCPLCGEFTVHRWIPLTKARREALMFSLNSAWINNHEACDLRRHRTHYDVSVLFFKQARQWYVRLRSRSNVLPYIKVHQKRYIMMSATVSRVTGVSIVCLTFCSGAIQRKHQSPAFVMGIRRRPVNFPHKETVTRKLYPFGDVIMISDSWWIPWSI